jgi:hypothetical protein
MVHGQIKRSRISAAPADALGKKIRCSDDNLKL